MSSFEFYLKDEERQTGNRARRDERRRDMFYAKFICDKYSQPTVGGGDGKPINFTVRAFDTKAARQAAIDAAWNAGGNGFKVTRKAVVGYFGHNFAIYGDECGEDGDPCRTHEPE